MEPVEYTDRKTDMTKDSPSVSAVEVDLLLLVLVALDEQRLHYVGSYVCSDQESDHIPSSHLLLLRVVVSATAETVNNHWGLYYHLQENEQICQKEIYLHGSCYSWSKADDGVKEERREAEKEQHVIQQGDGMGVHIEVCKVVVSEATGEDHDQHKSRPEIVGNGNRLLRVASGLRHKNY